MQGTVKKILADKGFGFISQEDSDKDIFFHSDKLVGISLNELKEGDVVSYDQEETEKGPAATNVQKV